jgi:hypothetical protein
MRGADDLKWLNLLMNVLDVHPNLVV